MHQLQVIDEEIPETMHDFSVDLVTPDEVVQCERRQCPNGIV
ncbi:hypothetical protein [Nocardiopsis suaedae]|uniref:Uncharacterized protein n=1 Tax=Nocardiopsis suaedae TaxID=3018444 RepID=A0ABT4TFE8_9ACTN|nr:hypothetical protein [Nocardiopsis suaedae]MDA2803029.1 hypothetical protein [Nocardiopsis suaedae]